MLLIPFKINGGKVTKIKQVLAQDRQLKKGRNCSNQQQTRQMTTKLCFLNNIFGSLLDG